ncbi:VanZ family protein [Patiriisocius hiemis]|uniref:VanZ family protein n=1 Tax=Patiriisocius hiemis TaxID=3075604 RepID=A0ABU2YAL0_9FLAO|nr:VanZ family protein [Constantimarinum sp. W242]MDT0555228.1 VanZ family protein [Constantimarinum sp. W242]
MMLDIKSLLAPKRLLITAIAYTIVITVAFLLPSIEEKPIDIKNFDKALHVLIYVMLVFLWLLFFRNKLNLKTWCYILGTIFLYGIIIEALQSSITTSRQADVFDVLANSFGMLIGVILFFTISKKIS